MKTITARLDDESTKALKLLQKARGWNYSESIRIAIKNLALLLPSYRQKKIIGIGCFESKFADSGSNKKHLKGFGR